MLRFIYSFLLIGCYLASQAQGIMGAEILKDYEYPYMYLDVWVWREGPSKPFIMFDWGDDTGLDTITLHGSQMLGINSRVDNYHKIHEYDTSGYIVLGFQDSFLVPGIKNIVESSQKAIRLYDTISFAAPELLINSSPWLFSQPANILQWEDGSLVHPIYVEDEHFFFDEYIANWHPFPADGYSTPGATNGFYVMGSHMIWDRPIETGRYAVGINIRETRNDEFLSSTLRAMLIDVTEDLIVSSNEMGIQQLLALYPNPTTTTTTLEYGGLSGQTHLSITNTQGQFMLRKTLNGTAQLQRETIDVSTWPAGIYWIELRNAQGQVTKKLIVK